MGVLAWCSRRVHGLSFIALLALSYWVLSREYYAAAKRAASEPSDASAEASSAPFFGRGGGIWSAVLAYYSLFIHLLVFITPTRACVAIWDLTASLRRDARAHTIREYKTQRRRRGSQTSTSSSGTLDSQPLDGSASSTRVSSDTEYSSMSESEEPTSTTVIHAIVIPNYKEELETLRETLQVLASHPHAAMTYDVYLGMEQRENKGEAKAISLVQQFGKRFRRMGYTLHPANIPGEAAGKGSNMAWAAKKLSENYSMRVRKNVVVTGIDADSHLASKFFSEITNMHLSYPDTALETLYAAPIIFDRNAHNVPAIVRTADILWCAAGISGLHNGSVLSPPTSVYSLPLILVDRVGGWDSDSEAIGEDLHMFVKCFFATNGNLTSRAIMSPVSQSNVTSGSSGAGIRGTVRNIRARYTQTIRHMWGSLDSGYALRQGVKLWRDRKRTTRAFRPLHQNTSGDEPDNVYYPDKDGSDGRSGSDKLDEEAQTDERGVFGDVTEISVKGPHWKHVIYMYHRLFEAHFLPVHMGVAVIVTGLYRLITEDGGDGDGDRRSGPLEWTFTVSALLRTAGLLAMAGFLVLYESYHRLAAKARERDMRRAGLDAGMSFSHRSLARNVWDYMLIPLVMPLYGTIPAVQVALAHFWTLDLVYVVSNKEIRPAEKKPSEIEMV